MSAIQGWSQPVDAILKALCVTDTSYSRVAYRVLNKKAPDNAGALSLLEIEGKSVAGGHWCPVTTEAVVDAQGE